MISDINLNLYRIFYICSKSKSFVEASGRLCISQPAISKQIKKLEELLDTKLFYRNSNGLVLTNDGKELLKYIDKSYNYLLAGEKVIKDNKNMDKGLIIIGAPAHIASFYLLKFIEEYRDDHPNVLFRIINGSTIELIKNLEEHKIDFIIDSSPITIINNEMKCEPLTSFETCLITSAKNKNSEFTFHKYIMPYERSSIRKNLEKELEKYDIKLNVILEVETTDLIISSVKKGIGSGYVVKKSVEKELKNGDLSELKTKYNLPKLELNLLYFDDYLSNLARFFIKNYIKQ